MKFVFEGVHQEYNYHTQRLEDGGTVSVSTTASSLPDLLDSFQAFLAGCGYSVRYGEIQYVPEDAAEDAILGADDGLRGSDGLVRWVVDNVEEEAPPRQDIPADFWCDATEKK